ncbi:MAG: DUF5005 domain-containing protein [Saprospiraceae bacterium]|nr:DUF5005 domain-containing protein [Saprospiraceae bacterium]
MTLLLLVFITCAKLEVIPTGTSADVPVDKGIYHSDPTRSDAFCEFKTIENVANCWNQQLIVAEDCHYNLLFTRYGNGWTGSDATYSIPLPDGRIMWMFGDTFLGTVTAQRIRAGAPFIRNSLIIQDGDRMTTLFGGNKNQPKAFVSPDDPGTWYWPLDATIYNGKIQWLLGKLGSNGTGEAWDFAYRSFDLAILDPETFVIEYLETVIASPDVSYGSCLLEDEDFTYIYGIWSSRRSKTVHIARVEGKNLQEPWSFYNGSSWIDRPSDHAIAKNVSDQFSVIKDGNLYYLITHETIFGSRIFIAESISPTGPWTNRRILYCTPESGENIFTYNSFVHPELATSGELRISYNINSFNFADIFADADLYRPKFIRIDNWK